MPLKPARFIPSRFPCGPHMTVMSGLFEIIQSIPDWRMLMADSAVLHHVQIPVRRRLPRRFKALRSRLIDWTGRALDPSTPYALCKAQHTHSDMTLQIDFP